MNRFYEASELRKADDLPYGNVSYSDPGYQADGKKRYPIDTIAHIRAAWSYINKPKNAGAYSADQVAHIKGRIVAAWKREIDPQGPPAAAEKAMPPMGFIPATKDEPVDVPNFNRTGITLNYQIVNGVKELASIYVDNTDLDPQGEEAEGSEDEKREIAHYAEVLACLRDALVGSEPDSTANAVEDAEKDTEGEASDALPHAEDLDRRLHVIAASIPAGAAPSGIAGIAEGLGGSQPAPAGSTGVR